MNAAVQKSLMINSERVPYRLLTSKAARRLRIRVGMDGVSVVRPLDRSIQEANQFLQKHQEWVDDQLRRVEKLRGVRKSKGELRGEILFQGVRLPVRNEIVPGWRGPNRIFIDGKAILVKRGERLKTAISQSLENWMRAQARSAINRHLKPVIARLRQMPNRVYVMGQRTKWGNCSSRRNLSFSWRLIMAPDYVLRYIVTHEACHLAFPDHSKRFWLAVQSLCPNMEQAKAWLRSNGELLPHNLKSACASGTDTH